VDLFDVVWSCIRRWYVVLPLLLGVAWYSHDVYTSVKPVYYSNAVIGVSPPSSRIDQSEPGQPVPRNGLLDVGGAPLIANMASIGLRDSSVVAQVVADGGQPDYIARMFPVPATSPELPLIMIEATEADPVSASKTISLVVDQAGATLRTLQQQANVPDSQMVTPFIVSPPSPPAEGVPSRIRSTLAIAIGGAGLAILAAVIFDVLLLRWTSRRQRRIRAAQPTTAGPGGPDADTEAVNRAVADEDHGADLTAASAGEVTTDGR
jgi:hypothetical protein